MGQLLSSDPTRSLILALPPQNVTQRRQFTPLSSLKWLEVPYYQKIFQYQTYKKIEITFKFFQNVFIHLEINKQKHKQEAGCPLTIGNEVVYGYKFKKNQKSDKIRPDKIFFRRKVYSAAFQPPRARDRNRTPAKGRNRSREQAMQPRTSLNPTNNKEEMLRKIAELKLLSKMEIGAKMARTIDGADGIITDHYIQFYSEVPIEKGEFQKKEPAEKQKLAVQLKRKGFKVKSESIQMAYSVFQKGYITRPSKKQLQNQQDPKQHRSIKFMVRACEQQINLIVCKLDGMTNMLSAIQNHLNYREIDKAMQKFQQNMAEMEQTERLDYAEQMAMMLSKYHYYQNYHNQVASYISTSRSSLAESRNLSSSRFERKNGSRDSSNQSNESANTFKTSRMSSEYDSRNPISPVTSPRSNVPLRYAEPDSPRRGVTSPEREHSISDAQYLRDSNSPNIMLQTAQERLKTAINENDKDLMSSALTCLKNLNMQTLLQTETFFGRLLLENGKPKYAKNIFQRLLYTKKSGKQGFICSEIECMLAFYHHSRGNYNLSMAHYEKALGQRFKFRNYSRKTAIIFNNLAVLDYLLERYEKSLLWLHRGFKLGEYCPDYELVMRSNYAMILAENGQLKQAKMEMYKTHKNVEPYCNMEVLCKFHSNLGYLQLCENILDKAKTNFDLACELQSKYLMPNHYKPSVFLHNNIAIYHAKVTSQHRKSQWKKAAAHLDKIKSQLPDLKGLHSVHVHFNFGRIMKENYELDEAVGYFCECRAILSTLKQSIVKRYQDKIDSEIQMIESQRIVEQSEESSCMNKISKLSKRSRLSKKDIESKIASG